MKKTLLIASNFFPAEGGIGSYMGIYFYLPQDSLLVLAPKKGDFEEFDRKSPLKTVRSRWAGTSGGLGRLVRSPALTFIVLMLLKRYRFQSIHIADVKSIPLLLWIIFRFLGIPVLSFIHGQELSIGGKLKVRTALRNSQLLIANSRFTRDILIGDFKVPIGKIEILNPGFNPDLLNVKPDSKTVKKRYNPDGKFVVLTVSRLVKRKGHRTVLESLARLKRMGFNDFVYLIVGRGPEENHIREKIRELDLGSDVEFVGYVDNKNLPNFYDACDVFVMVPDNLGGDYEGFGIVYLEAGAFSKPVVGSRSGGITDAIEDGKTGFLIDSGDPVALSNVLMSLAKNKELGAKLGRNGVERAKHFTLNKVAERFSSILDKNVL